MNKCFGRNAVIVHLYTVRTLAAVSPLISEPILESLLWQSETERCTIIDELKFHPISKEDQLKPTKLVLRKSSFTFTSLLAC